VWRDWQAGPWFFCVSTSASSWSYILCVYWCTKGDEALYNLSPILLFSHSRLLAALFVAKLLDRAELMCRWSGYLSIESRRSWVSTTRKQPSTDRSLTPTDAAVSSCMESSQTSRHAWIKMLMWRHNKGLFGSLVTLGTKVPKKPTKKWLKHFSPSGHSRGAKSD
jgi:hypothetical protein